MKVEEFNVPVPWGFVAVKTWGDSNDKPILVSHGRMDNAGSFDKLIPLLPKCYYYICIDLPSHGRSSHFPPFFPIQIIDFVLVYKLLLDYFNKGKYILLGHSFGAGVGILLTRLYPEYVEKLIVLDFMSPFVESEDFKEYLKEKFDNVMRINHKALTGNQPTYTKQEVIKKICDARMGESLSAEAGACLAERVMIPASSNRFYISTDQRMKSPIGLTHDFNYLKETIRLCPITCPYLLIVCEQSLLNTAIAQQILQELQKLENLKVTYVNGGHDVHMLNPEFVAPIITQFLLNTGAKL